MADSRYLCAGSAMLVFSLLLTNAHAIPQNLEPTRLPDLSPKALKEAAPPPPFEGFPSLGGILGGLEEAVTSAETPSETPPKVLPEVQKEAAQTQDFPEITFPENNDEEDSDLKLFESWLGGEEGNTAEGKPNNTDTKADTKVATPKVPEVIPDTEAVAEKKPKKSKPKKPKTIPYAKYKGKPQPFTFKAWRLPQAIYKVSYSEENAHLPVATYEENYDAQLFAAAARDDVTLLRAFLESGRDLEMTTAEGEGLLLHAVRYRSLNVVRMLLGRGADANRVAPSGGTALHYAVSNRDDTMALALLAGGAEPRLADRQGVNALEIAERLQQHTILSAMRRVMRPQTF